MNSLIVLSLNIFEGKKEIQLKLCSFFENYQKLFGNGELFVKKKIIGDPSKKNQENVLKYFKIFL